MPDIRLITLDHITYFTNLDLIKLDLGVLGCRVCVVCLIKLLCRLCFKIDYIQVLMDLIYRWLQLFFLIIVRLCLQRGRFVQYASYHCLYKQLKFVPTLKNFKL